MALQTNALSVGGPDTAWERHYVTRLMLGHVSALVVALYIALIVRELAIHEQWGWPEPGPALTQGLVTVGLWIMILHLVGSFEPRSLSVGAEEFKRITRATLRTFACVAMVQYIFEVEMSRWLVALLLPIGFALLTVSVQLNRLRLHRLRRAGAASYSILAVGNRETVRDLAVELQRAPFAGLRIVGACVPADEGTEPITDGIPVLGAPQDAGVVAEASHIDVVAATSGAGLPTSLLRELGWQLEGTGRKLLVAPGIVNVAGPRISVVPVAGVPLVWVDEPAFTGGRRLVKRSFDRVVASVLLLLASPLLLAVAVAIRLDSRGPVLFRQWRTGLHGEPFRVWKFRSMYTDAEQQRLAMDAHNDSDGHLFKIENDPRITRVGSFIRRWSLDELPQLLNVLFGSMSLVGPRPLPVADSNYEGRARRRLLVLPGITGLWQVSGRSRTTWEEATRLDLYYVENWSLSLDLVILARTLVVVVRGEGAY